MSAWIDVPVSATPCGADGKVLWVETTETPQSLAAQWAPGLEARVDACEAGDNPRLSYFLPPQVGPDMPIACLYGTEVGYLVRRANETSRALGPSGRLRGVFRLPTVAEYQCILGERPTAGTACDRGNVLDRSYPGWYDAPGAGYDCDDGYPLLAPVTFGAPNAYGLLGLWGNVNEKMAEERWSYGMSYLSVPALDGLKPGRGGLGGISGLEQGMRLVFEPARRPTPSRPAEPVAKVEVRGTPCGPEGSTLWVESTETPRSVARSLDESFTLTMDSCAEYREPRVPREILRSQDIEDEPAACLSQYEARYIAALLTEQGAAISVDGVEMSGRFRLPTAGEYACYAGALPDRKYPCKYANIRDQSYEAAGLVSPTGGPYCSDGYPVLAPVGSGLPNAYGLYGVWGNVHEWLDEPDSLAGGSFTSGFGESLESVRHEAYGALPRITFGMRLVFEPYVSERPARP